jgi:hypothetical protein
MDLLFLFLSLGQHNLFAAAIAANYRVKPGFARSFLVYFLNFEQFFISEFQQLFTPLPAHGIGPLPPNPHG